MATHTLCETCGSRHKSIFCDLEQEGLREIDQNKVSNSYRRGNKLFVEGNPPLGLYCISKGKVKLTKVGADGKESLLRIAGSGQVIGHRSLFSHELYMASATAMEDCEICFISKKSIFNVIKTNPSVSLHLIQTLSKEMGEAEKKSASLFQKSVRERLAELLLTLKESYGVQEGTRFRLDIKLTREEMASIIGTSSETVIRQMTDFKDEGLLEQEGKVIFLLKIDELMEVAEIAY